MAPCFTCLYGLSVTFDPAEERQPTDAEIDAELQKRINDLEQQKVKMQERLQLYRKINELEKDVGEMRGEIDTLKISVQRAEEGDTKVPDEGQWNGKYPDPCFIHSFIFKSFVIYVILFLLHMCSYLFVIHA